VKGAGVKRALARRARKREGVEEGGSERGGGRWRRRWVGCWRRRGGSGLAERLGSLGVSVGRRKGAGAR